MPFMAVRISRARVSSVWLAARCAAAIAESAKLTVATLAPVASFWGLAPVFAKSIRYVATTAGEAGSAFAPRRWHQASNFAAPSIGALGRPYDFADGVGELRLDEQVASGGSAGNSVLILHRFPGRLLAIRYSCRY
jgi:hypothetical protein